MRTTNVSRTAATFLVVGVLMLFQLACGSSTARELADAVPPTATPKPAATDEPLSVPTDKDAAPTNTPEPTAVPATPTPRPEPMNLVSQGFGQDGQELGYAFIVKNPNPGYGFEGTQYQVAVYDAEGTVVETDSSYIQLILPGQELGVSGTMYLNEGVTATKIEVQINAGEAELTDLTTTFIVDKTIYRPDEILPRASGVITNPYKRDIADVRVSAVLYDSAGAIIGGGCTYLNFVLASSQTGVDLSVTSSGDVARVELYPTVSGLSLLLTDQELPEGAQDLVLVKSGYGQEDADVGYGMLIQNPNANFAVENTLYHVTLLAEDGSVIATDEGYTSLLLPGQTLGVGGSVYVTTGQAVASASLQIKSGSFESADALPSFTAENVTYLPDRYFPKVTGQILSPYTKDITNLRVAAVAYNDKGDVIGGGYTYLDFAPANGKAAVEVNITCAGTPTTVELYASVSGLSDFD